MTQPLDPVPEYAEHRPLLPGDPTCMGDFWIDSRLAENPVGVVYCAHADGSDPVMPIHLRDGAVLDPAARAYPSGKANAVHIDTIVTRGGRDQDEGCMTVRFRNEGDDPIVASRRPLTPWVVLVFSGSPKVVAEAQRVLVAVDLMHTPQLGPPAGPGFQVH